MLSLQKIILCFREMNSVIFKVFTIYSSCNRDPDTMQVTASPEAPLPKIVIMGSEGREASTVRIGDKLTFRIEIPEGSELLS